MCKLCAALVAAVLGCGAPWVSAMNIAITPDAGLAANPAALAAFNRAATAWSNTFTDNITINLSVGLSNTFSDPNVIGHASIVSAQAPYDFFRGKIAAQAVTEVDDGIVAYLPTLSQFTATLPTGVTFSNKFVATKANFKALGYMDLVDLDAQLGANDATITFNSNFAFDYDNSNGVDANKIDFQSVAAHEIGHALGFTSSVDTVDYLKANNLTGSLVITPLDLFRFQNNVAGKDPTTTTEFTNFARFLDTGGNAILDDLQLELALSTGTLTGDGREAGHWKDDGLTGQFIGVMDPTMFGGNLEPITRNDIRALDLIGYDYVPEPASIGLTGLVVPLLHRRTRIRSGSRC